MKHLIQFVAVVIMTLLVVPLFAERLCLPPQARTTNMECCDYVNLSGVRSAVVQDCTGGCCSVAPQNPAPAIPDKLKADTSTPDTLQAVPTIALYTPRKLATCTIVASVVTHDLPILLHAIRI